MIAGAAARPRFNKFARPQFVVTKFTAKRVSRTAVIWGVVFGIISLSSIIGFDEIYKTGVSKAQLVSSFGHNAGLNALFGLPVKLDTAGGFMTWRVLGLAMIIGGIWGLLTATNIFRGEEENGRWELFLCGPITARRATINALVGLFVALIPLILIPSLLVYIGGRSNNLGYSILTCLFFGVSIAASAAIFIAVGMLASQLAPIRRKAAMYSALIFGLSFLVRAAGDADSSIHWLVNFSPFGWIENLHPLTDTNAFYLIPVSILILVLSSAGVYLAGKRDLGASLIADNDTAKARTGMLKSPFGLSLRLEKNALISWAIGLGFIGFLYGSIAKTATDVFKGVNGTNNAISKISGATETKGVATFLGVVFLLIMVVAMVEATNLVGATRNEEAEGYLNNLLVQPVKKLSWLSGRIFIIVAALVISVMTGSLLAWVATATQHVSIPFHEMVIAGINVLPAILFAMSFGIFIFGLRPRLTTIAMYGIIAGSFLLEMIGSAINLNHYILDISLLHHVALAPSVNPNWKADGILLGLGVIMVIVGAISFNSRDLQGE
jgi:ABC-2 type transport system permease protein